MRCVLPARLPLLAAIALFCAPALAQELPYETIRVDQTDDARGYEVHVHYPRTGVPSIDNDIAAWAQGEVNNIVSLVADKPADSFPYSLDINFEVPRNDGAMFGVIFTESTYTGGAHPNSDYEAFNYIASDGWRVYLPEIFEPEALPLISDAAIAELHRIFDDPDSMGDDDTIRSGAGPAWDNFENFILKPYTLAIYFPPYQVAAYAAGPQEIEIPLEPLKDLIRSDWRQPVPSFDCGKASTDVEFAICDDVTVARLDRSVAEAYFRRLRYEYDDAAKDAVKAAQRAWLAQRNQCQGRNMVPCLMDAYRARLRVLNDYS